MDQKTLRKVQLTLLEIAKEFKRVCNELNISYFLDSGTLLGAVRHKGFIPWDDDLDVGMLRNDYGFFLANANKVLSSDFELQSWYSDKNYGFPFAKIRMKDTLYIEQGAQLSKAKQGFYIDIFPYDVYPLKRGQRFFQGFAYDFYRRAIAVKTGYRQWEHAKGAQRFLRRVGYLPIQAYALLHTKSAMISKYERKCTQYNSMQTGLLYEQAGASNYGGWVIPNECFETTIEIDFEGEKFSCPAGYDLYLRSAYGNYMELPPKEKRYNRHKIQTIKFKKGDEQ